MQRKFINIISLILSLLIIFNLQSVVAFAENSVTTFYVESVTKQETSSTVSVNISVQNNLGIAGATLNVNYADGLTLVNATNGTAFSSLILTKPGSYTNNCKFLWDSIDGEATEDGVILTLTFEVDSSATGDLTVEISCNNGDIYNENLDTVEVQTVNGVVKTSSQSGDTPASNEPTFEVVSATKTDSTSTVSVDVVVKNNPGIAGATLNVKYADGLTLINATNGTVFSSLILTKPGSYTNNCKFLWDSVDGEATEDGVILTLTFEVDSSATGDLAVEISCNNGDIYNENLDTVEVQTVNGVVKTSSQSGDTPASNEPTFEVISTTKSDSTSTVSVDVVVKNNPGIAGATLNVKYADGLSLVNATNGTAFSELSLTTPGQFKSPCKFLWDSISGQTSSNGTILTLTFEVTDTSISSYDIEISCNDGDVYDENLNTVCMKTKNGTISVHERKFVKPKDGSTAKVDRSTGFITGLQPHLGTLDDYLSVNDGYEYEYSKTIGTGCVVNVKKSDTIVETYTIVIFGDVNGDAWYDGTDAIIVNCLANGMLNREQVGEAVYMASDCNHDGVIDQLDVEILEKTGLLLANVDQTKSEEELLETSSEYVEYLNLISQTVDDTDNTEDTSKEETTDGELNILQWIIKFIVEIFNYLKSFYALIK